jgi:DNA-binding protein HU-beta
MATKKAAKKSAAKKSPAKSSAKKSPAKKSSAKKSTGGQACWPGFKRVAGKTAGTKGSCEPKDKQTRSEKKADSKAAAASKREKGKG